MLQLFKHLLNYFVILLTCYIKLSHLWNLFSLLLGAKGHPATWQKGAKRIWVLHRKVT